MSAIRSPESGGKERAEGSYTQTELAGELPTLGLAEDSWTSSVLGDPASLD